VDRTLPVPAKARKSCRLDDAARSLARVATQRLEMSPRAFHRIPKLARTTADLVGSESNEIAHQAVTIRHRRRLQSSGLLTVQWLSCTAIIVSTANLGIKLPASPADAGRNSGMCCVGQQRRARTARRQCVSEQKAI
jgi:hypothetical protein